MKFIHHVIEPNSNTTHQEGTFKLCKAPLENHQGINSLEIVLEKIPRFPNFNNVSSGGVFSFGLQNNYSLNVNYKTAT